MGISSIQKGPLTQRELKSNLKEISRCILQAGLLEAHAGNRYDSNDRRKYTNDSAHEKFDCVVQDAILAR